MSEPDSRCKHSVFDYVRDGIFVIVAILSITAFFRTCKYDNELRRTNYDLNSIGNRPLLKLAGSPNVLSITIDTLAVKFKDDPRNHSGDGDDPHLVNITFSLDIESVVKITNISEGSVGKIIVLLTADAIPNVKSLLMGEDQPFEVKSSLHKWPELQNSEVLPGDTIELIATTRIDHVAGRQYRLHFVILYENETGHLFHTHVLAPFEFQPMMLSPTRTMKVSEIESAIYKIAEDGITDNTFMKPLSPVSSFEKYTEEESTKIRENLSDLISDLSRE